MAIIVLLILILFAMAIPGAVVVEARNRKQARDVAALRRAQEQFYRNGK